MAEHERLRAELEEMQSMLCAQEEAQVAEKDSHTRENTVLLRQLETSHKQLEATSNCLLRL